MKNFKTTTLFTVLFLISVSTFAQGKTKIIIKPPTNVDNPNNPVVNKMVCNRVHDSWAGGCYNIGVSCSNGGGLTVFIHVKSCVRFNSNFPDINEVPKIKLVDVEISVVNNEQGIDVVNLQQQYKNGNYEILDEVVQENDEEILIIKPGIYKVTNSKMHVLMYKQSE